jgi:hypothetical protein
LVFHRQLVSLLSKKVSSKKRFKEFISKSYLKIDVTDQDITIIDNLNFDQNKSDNTDNDVFEQEDDELRISENFCQENVRIIPIIKHSKPKFIKQFDKTSVKEGNELLLTCHVEGVPKPEIHW